MKRLAVAWSLLVLTSCAALRPAQELETIAVRVHNMDAMVAFYEEAFGFEFEPVETFGLASMFGDNGRLTLKFVPLLDAPDFVGFPSHQLGFTVKNWPAAVDAVVRHGGVRVSDVDVLPDGRVHVAVRDPDGNTLEIYGR